MTIESGRLSRSVEDYLKAVQALTARGETASTSALAEMLDVQPASVTGMVKRLAEWGLLAHVPYRGVSLTESGRREALRVLRRHRILETYLTEVLGYAWEEVHDEAERLEHAVSDRLIDAMSTALGDPTHDPHGAPIPTPDGALEASRWASLARTAAGSRVEIRAVDDKGAPELREMESLGLVPGATVRVGAREPDGRLVLEIGEPGQRCTVGVDLAELIFVDPVGAP